MNTEQDKGENGKREYIRPKLRIIELVAEEVLAVSCKISSGDSAPLNPGSCYMPSQCFTHGS